MIKKSVPLILTFLLFITACSPSQQKQNDPSKITVYTSFYPMYEFASLVGGDKINLINMLPSGGEVHTWEPSPSDIVGLENANVFIYSGSGMEPWVDVILGSIQNQDLIIVETSKNIPLIMEDDDHDEHEKGDHDHGDFDPHVWLNPKNAKIQTEAIKNALIQVDSENKEYYEAKYAEAAKKFDELDAAYQIALESYSDAAIFVSHKAFGYLCKEYGINQIAVSGLSDENEPDAKKLAEIIDLVKEYNATTIFYQKNESSKIATTIAQEVGAKTDVLNAIETLSNEEIKNGENYFTIMMKNLEAIKKALAK